MLASKPTDVYRRKSPTFMDLDNFTRLLSDASCSIMTGAKLLKTIIIAVGSNFFANLLITTII